MHEKYILNKMHRIDYGSEIKDSSKSFADYYIYKRK